MKGFSVVLLFLTSAFAYAADNVVHVYNWNDYIADEVVTEIEKTTGIKVVYDVYDTNEVLESKLLAGNSGYDVVFPSIRPFAQRHIKAGLYLKLDKNKLPNFSKINRGLLQSMQDVDPQNAYVIPYLWGTTGIGINVGKIKAALGDSTPLDTWELLFSKKNTAKLAKCGISFLDDEIESVSAALILLGKDINRFTEKDLATAEKLFAGVRRDIKYFHSSQYLNDLANGDICIAHGYSGDILQAKTRAEEAKNGVEIALLIPKEGALSSIDVIAIPKDAPHPDNAHRFINYLLQPQIMATITNHVSYANAIDGAEAFVEESIRNNKGIYPSPEVMKKLVSAQSLPDQLNRQRTRSWTRIKSGK